MNVKVSDMLKFENRKFQLISNVHCLEHMDASPVVKLTNLFELTQSHNHPIESYNSNKIILSNKIKRKAENSTCDLREVFNVCCRDSEGASGKYNPKYHHLHKNLEYYYLNLGILVII